MHTQSRCEIKIRGSYLHKEKMETTHPIEGILRSPSGTCCPAQHASAAVQATAPMAGIILSLKGSSVTQVWFLSC